MDRSRSARSRTWLCSLKIRFPAISISSRTSVLIEPFLAGVRFSDRLERRNRATVAARCSSPKRFDPIGLAYGAIAACCQRRFDLGRRQQIYLAGVGGDQECLGPRGFDVSQFLLNIVRNVGKPRTFVGERDHQGTLGAGDEIDV